jgi:hypothetical protein
LSRTRARRDHVASPSPSTLRLGPLLDALALAIVLAFAACVIAVNLGPHRIGGLDAETDFYGGYAPAAADLLRGQLLMSGGRLPSVYGFVGPLYPALLALTTPLARGEFLAALLLSLAAAIATLLLWGSLLRRHLGPAAGLAIVVLLATNGVFFRQAYWVTTDAVAVAFQSLAMWLLLTGRGEQRMAFAAGAAAALAFLTRYTSAWLLPAGIVALASIGQAPGWRALAARWAAFLGGFAVLALPWILFARTHGGTVQFHQLLLFDLYSTRVGMKWDDFLANVWPQYMNHPWRVYEVDPGGLIRHLARNLVTHVMEDAHRLTGTPLMIVAAAGLLLAAVRRDRFGLLVAQATAWSYLALVPAGYNDRYALAVLPGYAALAAFAIGGIPATRAGARWLQVAGALVLVAIGVHAARASVRLQASVLEQQPLEALECARVLRTLAQPGDRVIARKPHTGWLAGIGTEPYPASDDLTGLADAAQRGRARWLYLSASEALLRPRTSFLLDTTAVVPGLTRRALSIVPMHMHDGFSWPRIGILYEIGIGFGREPEGFDSSALRSLHTLRGLAVTLPNAETWLRLAATELALGDTTRARSAWREVTRIDPRGAAAFLASAGGDTLRALSAVP